VVNDCPRHNGVPLGRMFIIQSVNLHGPQRMRDL